MHICTFVSRFLPTLNWPRIMKSCQILIEHAENIVRYLPLTTIPVSKGNEAKPPRD